MRINKTSVAVGREEGEWQEVELLVRSTGRRCCQGEKRRRVTWRTLTMIDHTQCRHLFSSPPTMAGVEEGTGKGKVSGALLPRVLQSETIHSLNLLHQSAIFSAIQAALLGNSFGEAVQKSIQLQSLAKKATLRLDTSVKRSLCQRCSVPLIPGLTCTIQCQTFLASSRAVKTRCRVCSLNRRMIAPPARVENENQLARRRCKRQARRMEAQVREKLIKCKLAIDVHGSTRCKQPSCDSKNDQPLKKPAGKRWSQRMRRRAGKVKALQLKEVPARKSADNSSHRTRNGSGTGQTNAVRYTDRVRDSGWEAGWAPGTSCGAKGAIRALRGDHLLTSGVGRGGAVGALLPSTG